MGFILNSGKTKTLKLSSGIMMDIPAGAVSLPDDEILNKSVNADGDLKYISEEEFENLKKPSPKAEIKKEIKKKLKVKRKKEEPQIEEEPEKLSEE